MPTNSPATKIIGSDNTPAAYVARNVRSGLRNKIAT